MRGSASVCLLVVALFASASFAADSTVPGDFATIQLAIDDAGTVDGDTITVAAGTHVEDSITVTKEVTIAGSGLGVTFLECTATNKVAMFISADNTTVRDMTISDCSQAIRYFKSGGTIASPTVDTVEMIDNTSRGIEHHNSTTVTDLVVRDSKFTTTNHGYRVSSSGIANGVDFIDSDFEGNVIGIYLANDGGNTSRMTDLVVRGCLFKDHDTGPSGYGIFLEELQGGLIEDNEFVDNRRDIQLFKWYSPGTPMSDVLIQNNTMTGTTNAVLAIFNQHNVGGRTEFDDIVFTGNTASTADGSAVFASGQGSFLNVPPGASMGGDGWDTVHINCNTFTGITTPANGVRYFNPGPPNGPFLPGDLLGGDTLDVLNNWWGTFDPVAVGALMEIPAITDYVPFLFAPPAEIFCPLVPSTVFVTSTKSDGNLGGVLGADQQCTSLAAGAGLPPGPYKAWLSEETAGPATTFTPAGPYMRVDGVWIADDLPDLTDGMLAAPINVTENGNVLGAGTTQSWTGSNADGTPRDGGALCSNWALNSSFDRGAQGRNDATLSNWSFSGAAPCNKERRLYCFQQPSAPVDPGGPTSKLIFVSSTLSNGNLGGIAGADATCQALATAATLLGTYKAWLSDSSSEPNTTFFQNPTSYLRVDGALVATDYADLIDGSLAVPVNVTETGGVLAGASGSKVWTGTTAFGTALNGAALCADWSTSSSVPRGGPGHTDSNSSTWSFSGASPCNQQRRLYCVQQSDVSPAVPDVPVVTEKKRDRTTTGRIDFVD